MTGRPEFATNRAGIETVAASLNSLLGFYLENRRTPFEVCVATAYFNPEGFGLVAETLEKVPSVRLLLGAEPSGAPARRRHLDPDLAPERAERARVRDALGRHQSSLQDDRDLLGFTRAADESAKRLVQWLREGPVEVRRFESGFLHGKAFMVATDNEGVLSGSSNFTAAGLARNLELNLGNYQPHVVDQVRVWFDELWQASVPFDLAAIYEARFEPHNPYIIYLRMLFERYGDEIRQEADDLGTTIKLAQFQEDGVWRARRILDERNGVLVADGVGLGKTFIAGALIRDAVEQRRQRVLVVAPATLRDGPWEHFRLRYQLGAEIVSFEQLAAGDLNFAPNEYAMVIVDEAHGVRNPETQRAAAMRHLLQGAPAKKLVLLTATPVNNTLWDLYYLLAYFIRDDAAFADVGIRSLRQHFGEAMAMDPEDLSPDKLFDVLDAVGVRRTRHFVKRYYPHDRIEIDGALVPIQFPKPNVAEVDYRLDEVLPDFFESFAHSLTCDPEECDHEEPIASEPFLKLARYLPSRYLISGEEAAHERQVAGLLRSGLLKRFESSVHAFALTCERMAALHDTFLDLLERGSVATSEVLKEWAKSDAADLDEMLASIGEDVSPASMYQVRELRADVQTDRDLLRSFATRARAVTRDNDPKLQALKAELAKIATDAESEGIGERDTREKRKAIVFSYFAETVDWIEDFLTNGGAPDPYTGRVVAAVGGDEAAVQRAAFGFAPASTEAPPGKDSDLFDILITTDVLAEGVNLQQARHVINFDLPWNPMRLVQRHGRIDRIGSPHAEVFIRCFMPDDRLDELLRLEARLQRKITQAAMSVGVEDVVIPGSKRQDINLAEPREEIERLRAGDATLFETAGERHAHSGEEYRQELRVAFESAELGQMVRELPWGSGSGYARVGSTPGYVFCARVGDHHGPSYRFVDNSDPNESKVVADTLACLAQAQCDGDTVRVLSDATHEGAYEAWAIARQHIYEDWMKATDPANLLPPVPKVLRDAAQLLRDNPPSGYAQSEVDRMVDALETALGTRIQNMIRKAVQSDSKPPLQAQAVAEAVKELGLEPPHPPKPLPLITIDDVHLVCWMAVVTA